MEQIKIDQAVKFYEKHLKKCREYQDKNRELINERAKQFYKDLKQDKDKYALYLEKKRQRYNEKKSNPVVITDK